MQHIKTIFILFQNQWNKWLNSNFPTQWWLEDWIDPKTKFQIQLDSSMSLAKRILWNNYTESSFNITFNSSSHLFQRWINNLKFLVRTYIHKLNKKKDKEVNLEDWSLNNNWANHSDIWYINNKAFTLDD